LLDKKQYEVQEFYTNLKGKAPHVLLKESQKSPVVLALLASWSGASHILDLYMKEIALEMRECAQFYKADANLNKKVIKSWDIVQIPSTLILKKGKRVGIIEGLKSKKKIKTQIEFFIS
jgi:thioredoxin-like negative regulator of GroEL